MVTRERVDKVAFLRAIGQIAGMIFNVNADKAFGPIYHEYAREVFQETYNAELLAKKAAALRAAHEKVKGAWLHDMQMLERLRLMGEWADREFGKDIIPKKVETTKGDANVRRKPDRRPPRR